MYKVEREDGKGGERMLHRNNLLHLGSSLADEVKEKDKNNSSVDIEGLTNSSTRATPTPTPGNLKKLQTSKPRNKKVEIETEKEEDDSLFVVTETTDNSVNEIEEVDDELVDDLATHTQGRNLSTHEISDYMDHDPDQTDEGLSEVENVVTEEETSVKVVPEPRRLLPADATETEGNTSVDTSDNAAGNIMQRSTRFKQKPLWPRQGDFFYANYRKECSFTVSVKSFHVVTIGTRYCVCNYKRCRSHIINDRTSFQEGGEGVAEVDFNCL